MIGKGHGGQAKAVTFRELSDDECWGLRVYLGTDGTLRLYARVAVTACGPVKKGDVVNVVDGGRLAYTLPPPGQTDPFHYAVVSRGVAVSSAGNGRPLMVDRPIPRG